MTRPLPSNAHERRGVSSTTVGIGSGWNRNVDMALATLSTRVHKQAAELGIGTAPAVSKSMRSPGSRISPSSVSSARRICCSARPRV